MLTGSSDKTMKLWDFGPGKEINSFNAGVVRSIVVCLDGTYAVSCAYQGSKHWYLKFQNAY